MARKAMTVALVAMLVGFGAWAWAQQAAPQPPMGPMGQGGPGYGWGGPGYGSGIGPGMMGGPGSWGMMGAPPMFPSIDALPPMASGSITRGSAPRTGRSPGLVARCGSTTWG